MIFNVHFLPARYGDCIWIEYGDEAAPRRIIIDGGTGGTRKDIKKMLEQLPENEKFELLVVTHIDRDHIEGILTLLEEDELPIKIKDIWFNGWRHLPQDDVNAFGAEQGERLSAAILKHGLNWNKTFDSKAVVLPDEGDLPEINIAGGLKLTLLSPTLKHLKTLRKKWLDELVTKGLEPGFGEIEPEITDSTVEAFGTLPDIEALIAEPFEEDAAAANGSSIAFLAEFGGKTVLFAGDAFPTTILKALERKFEGKVPVDLCKLSHHASAGNTSPELISRLMCSRYAISTNGSIYKHPSQVTLARILNIHAPGVEFVFNYKTSINKVWDHEHLKTSYGYTATYPAEGEEGIIIQLL